MHCILPLSCLVFSCASTFTNSCSHLTLFPCVGTSHSSNMTRFPFQEQLPHIATILQPNHCLHAVASSTSTFNWRTFQPGQYKLAIGQKIQFTAIWGAGEKLQWNYPICSNLLEVISRLSSSQPSQQKLIFWHLQLRNGILPTILPSLNNHSWILWYQFNPWKTSLVKCEKVNIGEGYQRGQPPAGRFQIWIQPNIWSLAKWVGGRWVTLQRLFCQRQTIAT